MNEAEWLACNDPDAMLEFLRGRTSMRKPLLFLCASCRHVCHLSVAKGSTKRKLIEVVEQYVDGKASREQVVTSKQVLARVEERSGLPLLSASALEDLANDIFSWEDVRAVAWRTRYWLACHLGERARPKVDSWKAQSLAHQAWSAAELRERGEQADLLRDIFGDPFCPVTLSPTVLTWNDAVVVRLAQAAYEERHLPEGTLDNTRLLILADALEEAGCTNQDILAHCRSGGEHVRGCWVVDLLRGKE